MKIERMLNYKVKIFNKNDVKLCELRLLGQTILDTNWNFHSMKLEVNKKVIENKEDLQ